MLPHTAAAVLLARGVAGGLAGSAGLATSAAQPLCPFAAGQVSGNLLASVGTGVGRPLWLVLTFLGDAVGASMATLGADIGVAAAANGASAMMTIASMLVGTCARFSATPNNCCA